MAAMSVLFVGFLAVAATAVMLKWPLASSLFGIVDNITCERPNERVEAFTCGPAPDSYVVINIRLDDSDHGLVVRDMPMRSSVARGIIPPNATGVAITGACQGDWCPIQCASMSLLGWSRKDYLAPSSETLNAVTGTSPSEPGGLSIRTGPDLTCRSAGVLPYQSRDVILHWCEASPLNASQQWCRITAMGQSGWIPRGYLQRQQ
jgi:hypothetical protein